MAWGAISGAIGGGLTFDLNGIGYDLTHDASTFEIPTLEHLAWDLGSGALSGALGGLFGPGNKIGAGFFGAAKAFEEGVSTGLVDPIGKQIWKQLGMVSSLRGAVVSGASAVGSAVGSAVVNGATTVGTTAVNVVSDVFSRF